MEAWLKDHRNAHTQEFEHISKPNKRHIQLLVWLLKEHPEQVLYSEVEAYIRDNYGMDQRTVKKYLHDFLISYGFLKSFKAVKASTDHIMNVNVEKVLDYLSKFAGEKELNEKYGIFKEAYRIREEKREEKKEEKETIRAYAAERYEAGDSLDEIKEKLSDFGLDLAKRSVRNFVRKALRDTDYI